MKITHGLRRPQPISSHFLLVAGEGVSDFGANPFRSSRASCCLLEIRRSSSLLRHRHAHHWPHTPSAIAPRLQHKIENGSWSFQSWHFARLHCRLHNHADWAAMVPVGVGRSADAECCLNQETLMSRGCLREVVRG